MNDFYFTTQYNDCNIFITVARHCPFIRLQLKNHNISYHKTSISISVVPMTFSTSVQFYIFMIMYLFALNIHRVSMFQTARLKFILGNILARDILACNRAGHSNLTSASNRSLCLRHGIFLT